MYCFYCVLQQKFLYWSNFTLPTGWSMEEKRVIMPHYKKPLEKKRIFMAPEHKYAEWGPIAKVGGCLNMNDIQIGNYTLLLCFCFQTLKLKTCVDIVLSYFHFFDF